MSKLGTVVIGQPLEFRVEKPIHALGVVLTIPQTAFKGEIPSTIPALLEELETSINPFLNIDIKYQTRDGNYNQALPKLPVLPLLEIESQNEAHISVKTIASPFTGMGDSAIEIRGMITLSEAGAIPFDNDEVAIISMTEQSVAQVEMYAFDHPMASPVWNSYGFLTVKTGEKDPEFDVSDAESILIPISAITASTEIQLTYSNGKNLSYKKDELLMLGTQTNEVVLNYNGQVLSGFGNHIVINTTTAERLKISRQSNGMFDMYVVHENMHAKFEQSNAKNQNLRPTTGARKLRQINLLKRG